MNNQVEKGIRKLQLLWGRVKRFEPPLAKLMQQAFGMEQALA